MKNIIKYSKLTRMRTMNTFIDQRRLPMSYVSILRDLIVQSYSSVS